MPGTEPYTTTCKFCSKQIIMGLNPQSKWQPYDNYVDKEGHNCAARPKQTTIAAVSGNGENSILTEILSKVNAIESQQIKDSQNVSMLNWMVEKVAKKVGVDDLIDDTSK